MNLAEENTEMRRRSAFSSASLLGWFACLVLTASDQWLLGPSLFVLLLGWHFLPRRGEPPVVAAAFTYQWLQVTIALFYLELTGRQIPEMLSSNYRPMVLIGLASIVAFFGAYAFTSGRLKSSPRPVVATPVRRLSSTTIAVTYVATIAFNIGLLNIAWSFPALTQALFVLSFARYALLYMLMLRILAPRPRWGLALLVIAVEVAIGFSGYFASFVEPLVVVCLAVIASGAARTIGSRVALIGLALSGAAAGVLWTGIKPVIRSQYSATASMTKRLENVFDQLKPILANPMTSRTWPVDRLVGRMWQLEYPSMAYKNVPAVIPFDHGNILKGAIFNTVMPRVFFPNKGILASSSDLVRKYAGRYVAGRETNTSIAFGYVAEAYVDFGWPMLLTPIFVFGCLLGFADRIIRRALRSREVMQAVRVVILWSSMYLFETSWVIMLGTFVSLFVVLIGFGLAFERLANLSPKGDIGAVRRTPLAAN